MKKFVIAIAAGALAVGGTAFTVASEALSSVNVSAVHSAPSAVNWGCRGCPFGPDGSDDGSGSVNWNYSAPDSVNWSASVNWNAPESVNWSASVNWNAPVQADSVNWN